MINKWVNPAYKPCKCIYEPNIGTPKYINQILTDLKGEFGNNIIIVGHFNTPTYINE